MIEETVTANEPEEIEEKSIGSATYSPEDNKIRIYPLHRLPQDVYQRVKAAGFIWAPKQELFVAPMWTPTREDLARGLCGQIDDEDTSLVDRQEQRAERFEGYSDRRQQDADRAHAAVNAIADNIPLGQPILIGHHSERHARKDAERIQNGMRKAVECWKASGYWQERAAGALRHAKYKELPGVRYRRIKGLEADKRKQEKYRTEAEEALRLWTACAAIEDKDLQMQTAIRIAGSASCRITMARKEGDRPDWEMRPDAYTALTNNCPNLYAPRTLNEVLAAALSPRTFPASIARYNRWVEHYENRIAYERAMLDEQGGLKGEQFNYEVGGRILRRGSWLPIMKVNKRGGVIQSVTVSGHFASTVSVDEIREYQPPIEGAADAVKQAMAKGPMCNYPGEGFKHMTTGEWKQKKMSDVPQAISYKATDAHGKHRTRATYGGNWTTVAVYLTDAKRVDPPAKELIPTPEINRDLFRASPAVSEGEAMRAETARLQRINDKREEEDAAAAPFRALEEQLKTGVKVVVAPQLFPTPPELAARMVQEAGIEPGHRVLEPSAGTGNILKEIPGVLPGGEVVAVEISSSLIYLSEKYAHEIVCGDFLEQNGNLGKFDRVVMNPPFINGADIKHIQHAMKFLKPGGRLVAICANGSRQREALKPLAENSGGWWEDLPAGTFKEQGTGVNTALLVIEN
jgi:protein-L-isoaspartate O-methyltransferase